MNTDNILSLLRLKQTVFTLKDVALVWGETDTNALKKKMYRYVKGGKLYSIRRGIYSKDKNYDRSELATKIFTPSYISLETVLAKEGVIFQYYSSIFVISYLTREIDCDGHIYSFKKIKEPILTDTTGIDAQGNYFIASKERALLDILYLNKDYHFDNLSSINWDKCFEIVKIYNSKALNKKLNLYYKREK